MNTRLCLVVPVASLLLFLPHPIAAQRNTAAAMVGQVTSVEEGPMEGVLVSARKAGSTITTTVVTDQQGRYAFPRARLEPGEYALRIRAIGYEMARPVTVPIRGQQATTAAATRWSWSRGRGMMPTSSSQSSSGWAATRRLRSR